MCFVINGVPMSAVLWLPEEKPQLVLCFTIYRKVVSVNRCWNYLNISYHRGPEFFETQLVQAAVCCHRQYAIICIPQLTIFGRFICNFVQFYLHMFNGV